MKQEPKEFSICAKTCTLLYNSQDSDATILGNHIKYIIPIYQRPYSWSEEQIKKFLSDIFISYWGSDEAHSLIEEPMFIGTMQLSQKDDKGFQQIIDGQQRISTFLVLLKVLKQFFPDCIALKNISIDFLETKVGSGSQQSHLSNFINHVGEFSKEELLNPYIINACLMEELLKEHLYNDFDNEAIVFDIDKFLKHILGNIYLVVIETKAGLSKTLQIFNAINTTGLDLNGGDIFKIRMYEYLRDIKGKDDSIFEDISNIYKTIDDNNTDLKSNVSNINDILSIYQYVLIAKYGLPTALYNLSTDTFFERLFDTVFNINQWEHFRGNVSELEISIVDLKKIIDVRYEWTKIDYPTIEDACAMNFIWWSRYHHYWKLVFVAMFNFKEEGNELYLEQTFAFIRQLSKLFIIYSIRFQRIKSDIYYGQMHRIINMLVNGTADDVMKEINRLIGTPEGHNTGWYDLNLYLTENLTENTKRKNIVCRLSAMLEEDYKSSQKDSDVCGNLFSMPIDIEHIEPFNNIDESEREKIWNEWGDEINSLGNLVVLEQEINRSISNSVYDEKIKQYTQSKFQIIQKQLIDYKEWNLEKSKERKQKELNKILNYLFS